MRTRGEKEVDRYLVMEVEKAGGVCLKYDNGNKSGYPDRICLMPGGVTFWVELKGAGLEPRPLQWERIKALRELGHTVYVADSYDKVDMIIKKHKGNERQTARISE